MKYLIVSLQVFVFPKIWGLERNICLRRKNIRSLKMIYSNLEVWFFKKNLVSLEIKQIFSCLEIKISNVYY